MRCFCWEEGRFQFRNEGWNLEAALKKNIKMTWNSLKRRNDRTEMLTEAPRGQSKRQPEKQPTGRRANSNTHTHTHTTLRHISHILGCDQHPTLKRSQGFYSQKHFRRPKRVRGGGEVTRARVQRDGSRLIGPHCFIDEQLQMMMKQHSDERSETRFCSYGLKENKKNPQDFGTVIDPHWWSKRQLMDETERLTRPEEREATVASLLKWMKAAETWQRSFLFPPDVECLSLCQFSHFYTLIYPSIDLGLFLHIF